MNRNRIALLSILSLGICAGSAAASITVTQDYRQLLGGSFGDSSPGTGSALGTTFSVGGVGITPSSAGAYAYPLTGSSTDPAAPVGDYAFVGNATSSRDGSLFLNFDRAVSALGVTFRNGTVADPTSGLASSMGKITLYDGPFGTGNLLGTAVDAGPTAASPQTLYDFLGVSTGVLNIRSAVVTGSGPDVGYSAHGFAVSTSVAVPEPAAYAAFLALLPMAALARRRASRPMSHGGDSTHG